MEDGRSRKEDDERRTGRIVLSSVLSSVSLSSPNLLPHTLASAWSPRVSLPLQPHSLSMASLSHSRSAWHSLTSERLPASATLQLELTLSCCCRCFTWQSKLQAALLIESPDCVAASATNDRARQEEETLKKGKDEEGCGCSSIRGSSSGSRKGMLCAQSRQLFLSSRL